jgi:hypothetical protein
MKSIVLKSLLLHETIESDAPVLILRRVICRHFVSIIVLLSRPLILNFSSRLLLGKGSSSFDWVEKFNDIVQVDIHFLVLRSDTCETHLANSS